MIVKADQFRTTVVEVHAEGVVRLDVRVLLVLGASKTVRKTGNETTDRAAVGEIEAELRRGGVECLYRQIVDNVRSIDTDLFKATVTNDWMAVAAARGRLLRMCSILMGEHREGGAEEAGETGSGTGL